MSVSACVSSGWWLWRGGWEEDWRGEVERLRLIGRGEVREMEVPMEMGEEGMERGRREGGVEGERGGCCCEVGGVVSGWVDSEVAMMKSGGKPGSVGVATMREQESTRDSAERSDEPMASVRASDEPQSAC